MAIENAVFPDRSHSQVREGAERQRDRMCDAGIIQADEQCINLVPVNPVHLRWPDRSVPMKPEVSFGYLGQLLKLGQKCW